MAGLAQPHPDPEQLHSFSLGTLDDEAASARVEAHLETCADCRHELETVAGDTLERLVRAADTETASFAPAPAPLIDHPRYRIQERLGAGGMGVVYKARHTVMDRVVALKVVSPRVMDRAPVVERFRREVKAAARLTHPNIVTAYDAEQAGDTHFLVMEFVPGRSLAQVLGDRSGLPVGEACDYARQAALGLHYAHEQGMVHRDIKPANLMVTPGAAGPGAAPARVKILDFGLARLASELGPNGSLTEDGAVMGTPDYIAPEQADDPRRADTRADVYSLGCTLYHLLAGRPPFPEGTFLQKFKAHQTQEPAPLSGLRPDVPPGLAAVVGRMMAKDPARRYQTPAEAAEALAPFATPAPPQAPAPGSPPRSGTAAAPKKPRRGLLVAAAVVGVFAAGLAAQQVILRIKDDKGNNRDIPLKPGDTVEIVQKPSTAADAGGGGEPRRAGPGHREEPGGPRVAIKPEPLPPVRGGEPLSPTALVQRPAEIKGVRSWTLETVKPRGPLSSAVYSPDGKLVSALSGDGSIRVLDAADGRLVRVLVGFGGNPCWAPDGRFLACWSGADGLARVFDMRTGGFLRTWPGGLGGSNPWSPDGTRLVAHGRKGLEIREVATGKVLRSLEGEGSPWSGPAWSPDGKTIAIGAHEPPDPKMKLLLCDADTLRVRRAVGPLSGNSQQIVWSPDGTRLFTQGTHGTTACWDLETDKVAWEHGDNQGGLAVSPDGATLAIGPLLHEAATGKVKGERLPGSLVGSWSPDGKTVLTVGGDGTWSTTLSFCDAASGKVVKAMEGLGVGNGWPTVLWSADGKAVSNGFQDRFWDTATGKPLGKQPPARYTPFYSPDGEWRLELAGEGGRVVHVSSGKAFSVPWPVGLRSPTAAWSADSKRVALPSRRPDGTSGGAQVWDVRTGKRLQTLGDESCQAVAFSPDGKLIASGNGAVVRLWDAESGELIDALKGHAGHGVGVRQLLWSADGKTLTSSAEDGMRDWDVATGREIRQRRWRMGWPSPEGRLGAEVLVNAIRVWDLETGQPRLTVMPLPDDRFIAFSPDGHYRGSRGVERGLVYVVQLHDGRQETLTPAEFASRYGWKNDPEKVGLAAK